MGIEDVEFFKRWSPAESSRAWEELDLLCSLNDQLFRLRQSKHRRVEELEAARRGAEPGAFDSTAKLAHARAHEEAASDILAIIEARETAVVGDVKKIAHRLEEWAHRLEELSQAVADAQAGEWGNVDEATAVANEYGQRLLGRPLFDEVVCDG